MSMCVMERQVRQELLPRMNISVKQMSAYLIFLNSM